ncbi:MAG: sigma-54 interaction domain-containing protein [bacterium]
MQNHFTKNPKQLAVIFDHLPDGIITISGTKPSLISNINAVACKILKVEKQKVLGEKMQSVFKAQYSPLLQIVKETLEQNRCIKNFNLELETGRQERVTFLVNTVFFIEPEATQKSAILILHDISEVSELPSQSAMTERFETLLGSTASMKKVFALIDTVAPTDAAILINGETGTGKELVARAIHQRSQRSTRPFVPVHCSALTSSLLESDLFGHVKGAFTGAIKDKPGRFEMADGGTVFLDEIATLSQEIQINLLRVLQEKTIERVGDTKSTHVDVRIISATNHSLPDLIRQGVFRKDLYYRIKVIQINLPPLRKRKSDIPILAKHFIERFNRQHGCNILGLTKETMRLLKSYPWPGNVRELENAIEHAVIISKTNMIEPACIPEEILDSGKSKLSVSPGQDGLTDRDKIRKVLMETGGNVTRAAQHLGIHRTTLWRKMRELGIPRVSETSP